MDSLGFPRPIMSFLTTVIPVYNGADFIERTLDSIAAQTRRPDRLVVLDDVSTDSTRDLAAAYSKCEVEVIQNEKNLGLFPNHNRALDFAEETDFLHIQHANDLIKPDFYEELLGCFDDGDSPAMAFCQYEIVGEEDELLESPCRPDFAGRRKLGKQEFLSRQAELKPILIDAVIHRTGRRKSPRLFPLDYPQLGDVMFHAAWAVASEAIYESSRTLCQFRRHQSSVSNANTRKIQAWVVDEWRAIAEVSSMMDDRGLGRWLRMQKLQCLFSARTRVKMQMFRDQPDYAREIAEVGKGKVGGLQWMLGGLAVKLRDLRS